MTDDLTDIPGIGPARADALRDAGFDSIDDVASATVDEISDADGIGQSTAERIASALGGGDGDVAGDGGDASDETPPSMGRPSKLTMQRQERIASLLEQGHSVAATCRTCGITQRTFYNWVDKGEEQNEGVYADFLQRIVRARGQGEIEIVDSMREMAEETNDARTMLSILKNRFPESWGDDDDVEEESGDVTINLSPEGGYRPFEAQSQAQGQSGDTSETSSNSTSN